jgi:hypothetical protein
MRKVSLIVLRVLLGLTAAAGVVFLVMCVWAFLQIPRASGNPYAFIIVEIHSSSGTPTTLAKIYLEAPSAASDLKFEGDSLIHQFKGVSHIQAAVPLNGVVVSGSGSIVFGRTRIKIDNGAITVDDRLLSVCGSGSILLGTPSFEVRGDYKSPGPLEIVLGRNGWYFEGFIHLGERLLTSSLIRRGEDSVVARTL